MQPEQSLQKYNGLTISALRDNNKHFDDYLLVEQIQDCILVIVADGVSSCTSGFVASCLGSHSIAQYLEKKITETLDEIDYHHLLNQSFRNVNRALARFAKLAMENLQAAISKIEQFDINPAELEEVKHNIKRDLENDDELTFKATINLNLFVPNKKGYIVYNLCGGDSPSFFVDHLYDEKKTSIRPFYVNGIISSYLNNLGNYTRPHIGSALFTKGQKLLVCSDGVNLFYEDTPLKRRKGGMTLLQYLREDSRNFHVKFHELRKSQNAISDDYSCILVDFGGKKPKSESSNSAIQKKTLSRIPGQVREIKKEVEKKIKDHTDDLMLMLADHSSSTTSLIKEENEAMQVTLNGTIEATSELMTRNNRIMLGIILLLVLLLLVSIII